MIQKLAVDFILLPSEKITRKLTEMNNLLRRDYSDKRITFDKKSCIPHVSFLMGTIAYNSLREIKEKLDYLSEEFVPMKLEAIDFTLEDLPAQDRTLKIVGLKIKEKRKLRELHERIANEIGPFLIDSEVNKYMMHNSREIDSSDTPWMFPYIKNFIRNSSYEKFNPHVTIGDGILEQKVNLPMKFTTTKLAVAHLGNYCTCKEIL